MHMPSAPHQLVALTIALEAAGSALELASGVPPRLRCLADQLVRAASSVPANLSEGHGRCGRDRLHHYLIAYASAKEVDSHLRLLGAAHAVDHQGLTATLELFDRVRAMIWRLMHPRR